MKRFLLYILVLTALVGCGRNEIDPTPNSGPVMTFAVPGVEEGRSTLISNASQLTTGTAMGVYGMYEVGNEPIFDSNKTNHPQEVTNAGGGNWTYTPPAPWKQLMNHKFRAFYPYDADGTGELAMPDENVQEGMSNANRLVLDYYTQVNKFDLMVAYTTRHPYNETQGGADGLRPVEMPFKHALSALRFKVKHGATDGSDKLKGAYLNGISASGVLLYQSTDGSVSRGDWTLAPVNTMNLYSWVADGDGKTFTNTTTATAFGSSDTEVIFAIPQQVAVGQTKFSFSTSDSADTSVILPGNVDADSNGVMDYVTWEPGVLYEYTIVVKGASLEVTVTIKEWEEFKSNVDIYIGNS